MRKKHEREADAWADNKLRNNGYRTDQMVFVFSRLKKANDGIFRAEHPGLNTQRKKNTATEETHPIILDLIQTLPP